MGRVLNGREQFQAARAIEENVDELRELGTNFERAEALSRILGFDVTVANFVSAAACIDPELFPKTKQLTMRDQVRMMRAEIDNLKARVAWLESAAEPDAGNDDQAEAAE